VVFQGNKNRTNTCLSLRFFAHTFLTELHLVAQKGVIDDQGQQIDVVSSACFCGEVAMAPDSCVQFSVHTCQECVDHTLLRD
jgi:hypothetical protein